MTDESMQKSVSKAADNVLKALKKHVPGDKHDLLGEFALVRNWAELGARTYDRQQAGEIVVHPEKK